MLCCVLAFFSHVALSVVFLFLMVCIKSSVFSKELGSLCFVCVVSIGVL